MKKFYLKFFLFLFFYAVTCVAAAAQTQNSQTVIPRDLSNVSVNDLTDTQIRQMMQEADNNGLTDDELLQMASDRGLPSGEVSNLRNRIKKIRNPNGTAQNKNNADNNYNNPDTSFASNKRRLNYRKDSDSTMVLSRRRNSQKRDIFNTILPNIFGADIFSNPNSSFTPNLKLAPPKNYILGPEDQLNISVYGNSLANWKLDVSPEGNINIPVAGIISVAGRTLEEATNEIKRRLIAYHFAVGNGTSVHVTLGNIRSINVVLIGYVKKPGTYTVPSLATAFDALYEAGGPTDKGTFRKIEIVRDNKVIRTLDIYDFLIKGDRKNDINLQDRDIIRVPPFTAHVEMAGEVNNPAIFEMLPGETLSDLIRFAGGFTDRAYTKLINVYQVSDRQRKIVDVREENYGTYKPARGDKFIVERILDRFENRVTITGAVFRPGNYQLENGITVTQLIEKSGGLKEDAFTGNGSITRLNPDNSRKSIAFSIRDLLNKTTVDIPLEREDSVYISSVLDLRDKYLVSIKGEVRNPGEFMYADSMTVTSLVIKAGGLIEGGNTKRIEVAQRLKNANGTATGKTASVYSIDIDPKLNYVRSDFVLHPFDIVSVYSIPDYQKQRIVTVEGEVLYPGPYVLESQSDKISDIIKRAGYLKNTADANGSSLKRTNIAILGVDKNKTDSAALLKERLDHFRHLQSTLKDSAVVENEQARNNYIGINLNEILKTPGSVTDLIMEDGDVLRVPKKQEVVRVNGEVLYPSAVVYENSKGFREYVLNAGGFSAQASKRRAYIVYPNGSVKGTRKFLFFNSYPEVKPGSEIYVPKKPEPKYNNGTEIIALTTGLASLGAIILGILSLHK